MSWTRERARGEQSSSWDWSIILDPLAVALAFFIPLAFFLMVLTLGAKGQELETHGYSCADVREFVRTQPRVVVAAVRASMTKEQITAAKQCLRRKTKRK